MIINFHLQKGCLLYRGEVRRLVFFFLLRDLKMSKGRIGQLLLIASINSFCLITHFLCRVSLQKWVNTIASEKLRTGITAKKNRWAGCKIQWHVLPLYHMSNSVNSGLAGSPRKYIFNVSTSFYSTQVR